MARIGLIRKNTAIAFSTWQYLCMDYEPVVHFLVVFALSGFLSRMLLFCITTLVEASASLLGWDPPIARCLQFGTEEL